MRPHWWDRYVAYTLALVIVVAFLLVWQHVGLIEALVTSRPTAVASAFAQWFTNPALRGDIPISLEEAGISFVGTMVFAALLASFLAYSKLASALAAPYISLWNAVPKIALAPVFIFVFGIGVHAKVYFTICATFITPFFAIYRGLTSVDVTILAHAKILGASRRQLVRDVFIPSVIGTTLAVLRVVTQFCLIAGVLSELIASSKGSVMRSTSLSARTRRTS